ncbi:MAG TPA: ribosome recycling factor [Flavipsychrobacter sp.]|nr:ribosome recycling factor [Flavipsychrobacter sp.]
MNNTKITQIDPLTKKQLLCEYNFNVLVFLQHQNTRDNTPAILNLLHRVVFESFKNTSQHYLHLQPEKRKPMAEALDMIIEEAAQQMKRAISHLEAELAKIRAGKANPVILDGIFVEYYGAPTALAQVANVTVADARTLSIQPWEKNMLGPIEKAIIASNIGLNPQNDGNIIRLFLPPLTEERRKELVKRVNGEGEQAKVSVRSIRREAIEQIKKEQKDGLSEDVAKEGEVRVQGITDKFIVLVDQHCKDKDKEIMTI